MAKSTKQQNAALPEYTQFQPLANVEFLQTVRRMRAIKVEMEKLEQERKALAPFVEAMLMVAEQKAVKVDNLVAETITSHTAGKINAQKLVECGVEADLIAACTEEGKEYSYVQVREAK